MTATARFRLTVPDTFGFRATITSHGWADLAPFRITEDWQALGLTCLLPGDRAVSVTLRESGAAVAGTMQAAAPLTPAERKRVKATVADCLRLEEDLAPLYARLRREPRFRWARRIGAGRLLRSPTVFEDLVKLLCTTNCSWSLTRIMVGNLVERLGVAAPDGTRAFPTPAAMADRSETFYRSTIRAGYRAPYFRALARRVARGELDLEAWRAPTTTVEAVRAALADVKGAGEYVAANLLRLLGRYEALGLDSACRAMYARRYPSRRRPTDRAIARRYQPFAPWQGLVMWLDFTRDWHLQGKIPS